MYLHPCMANSTDRNTAFLNETCSNFTIPGIDYMMKSVKDTMRITSMISYSIIALSVLGNSTIIGIVLRNKSMRTKANVLIVNMAVSDLLATFFALPRSLYVAITKSPEWESTSALAEASCKLVPFAREVSCAVSIFSIVAIALDRFYAIVIPLAQKPRLLKHKFVIPGIWVAAIAANALYLYAFQVKFLQHTAITVCFELLSNQQRRIFDTFRFVSFIAVPLIAIICLYSAVVLTMARRPALASTTRRRRQNQKIVQLAVTITVVFFISWVPYYISLLLFVFDKLNPYFLSPYSALILIVLEKAFEILTYAGFAINPIICLIFSSNFRKHIYFV
ncbi:neuropeptide FF receptor 2-like [Actinia tenebrosa]|uniref:Neuropeptide FF receptor 2-like n=1 Tax=Actinia tenebrosa TaxID=6105 RepID=A0A6P8HYE2_ACTTE|nr:neuropeptide FF receptor 2-like [Actinia tenebrosa]